jgi:hypothetical protein
MNDLRESIDGLDLFDRLRGVYRFYCPEYAVALSGFINGFCLSAEISPEPFTSNVATFVKEYFHEDINEPWTETICRNAGCHRSEIPLIYAAADFSRRVIYENTMSWVSSNEWRAWFAERQKRINGQHALAAPVTLMIAEGSHGYWHLFYLDGDGQRFFEASMMSSDRLIRWAESVLHIDRESWKKSQKGIGIPRYHK